MTPAEESYRDMWLAEMGAVVRQYVAPIDPRTQAVDKRVHRVRGASTERKSA